MSRADGHRAPHSALLLGLLGALVGVAPISAQKITESRWSMQEARGGFCIWYLVDPAMAPSMTAKRVAFAPAGTGLTLPNALAQTIRDEPRFTSWIPAAVCLGFYASITIGDAKPIVAAKDQPLVILTHLVAAQSPLGIPGAGFLLLKLGSNSRVVRSQGDDPGLSIDGVSVLAGKDRGTTEDRVEFELEGSHITWIGYPSGEPSVETTRSMSFGYAGARSASWKGVMETSPAETRVMIGTLRVEGKSPLAKALKSSPIRAVGPIEMGGTARLLFEAVPFKP